MAFAHFKINPKMTPQTLGVVLGVMALTLVVFWIFKLRAIQRLRAEIAQLETRLMQGQELWKSFPPLTAKEKRELQKAHGRLLQMLPREKEIPSLLQEISRLARNYHLSDVSFRADDGSGSAPASESVRVVPGTVVSQAPPQTGPAVPESPGPVASFPVKVAFTGDYREIAYFLQELQKVPRLVTIHSVQFKRGLPLLEGEIQVHAYYQKGELPLSGK